jgi:hypothetical protein
VLLWKTVRTPVPGLAALCLAAALLGSSGPAAAEAYPSSDVLVPYFEVALQPTPGLNTLFSICNDSDHPLQVQISINTNWGIPVLQVPHTVQADEVHTVNLYAWIVEGRLFDRTLTPEELSHVQAALSGKPSPRDGKWYGTEVAPGRAVGSVTIRTTSAKRPDVLWGDYFIVDPATDLFQGETLANIDENQSDAPCERHAIRFLNGGAFQDGTELIIWTGRRWAPSPTQEPLYEEGVKIRSLIYNEPGLVIGRRDLTLLPVQTLQVSSLSLPEPFGWMDLVTDDPSYITAHYLATNQTSGSLHAYCLKSEAGGGEGPAIRLRKRVNGEDADQPPGLAIPVGSPVTWEYEVTNLGTVTLSSLEVTDNTGVVVTCPQDFLDPGESLVCTASGTAEPCEHVNIGSAVAAGPDGTIVTSEDPAYYTGSFRATIAVEKAVNGQDADQPPGPAFPVGTELQWTFVVTNTGTVALTNVTVTDDSGLSVTCPKTTLQPGESMTCTAGSTAVAGDHVNVATAKGKPPCGTDATASDPVYIHVTSEPGIDLEKLTNGEDADQEPGPSIDMGGAVHWTYRVTNIGNVALKSVAVSDDHGVAVTCPKTTLAVGETMDCTGSGVAQACQYGNLGTATALEAVPPGQAVSDQDASHYFGQIRPAVTLVKLTNGTDDPELVVGDTVHWTYTATNTGNVALTGVTVTDDRDVAVSCPKTTLQPAESMTCTAQGTVVSGHYQNVGMVTGKPPCGADVSASDGSSYIGRTLDIGLEKLVNGADADVEPYPVLVIGAPVLWTYVVTNTGDAALANVAVTDSEGWTVTCPKTVLAAGESMICTASGTALEGTHTNLGTATGSALDRTVTATDPATYVAHAPASIFLEKRVNGEDADTPTGPAVLVGSTLQWTFVVTNNGGVGLTNVTVTDPGLTVSCPKTALVSGETMTCTATGTAAHGQHQNVATAVGTPPSGPTVSASDPAHYLGLTPGISLEKLVNGQDADTAPGVLVVKCSTLQWSYVVTNTGEVPLANVTVVDDQAASAVATRTGGSCPNPVPFLLTCPKTTLAVGETMTCTASSTAKVVGQHVNVATAKGTPQGGSAVSAEDAAYYKVVYSYQGCTPGYWKNHTGSWPATGYATGEVVLNVFSAAIRFPELGYSSLLQALSFQGGSSDQGAAEILLRAGVAALLNAAHPNVTYPRTEASVLADVNLALTGSRDQMLTLAAALDADNNRGCPLN